MALLLFVVALGIVDEINDDNSPDRDSSDASVNTVNTVEGITLVALTAKFLLKTKAIKQQVAQGECEPTYDCFQSLGEELVQDVVAIGLNRDAVEGGLEGYLGSVSKNLTNEQQTELSAHLQQFVDTKKTANDNKIAEQASIKKIPY